MKIALIGSAPSSVRLAPYSDPSWLIWGCSPGVYPVAGRINAWFELHRWEPPVIGKPDLQKPWFSPEYVQWMAQRPLVWMQESVPEIPASQPFPWQVLVRKYGHYNFTSTVAWMMATAIETLLQGRKLRDKVIMGEVPLPPGLTMEQVNEETDHIGLWGVDMAATEEYGYQRAGLQFFWQIADKLGIEMYAPPESDLMVPPPLYGICEGTHKHIKLLKRKEELVGRMQAAQAALQQATNDYAYMRGAVEDNNYHLNTWIHEGDAVGSSFKELFQGVNDPVQYPFVPEPVFKDVAATGETRSAPVMEGSDAERRSYVGSWRDRAVLPADSQDPTYVPSRIRVGDPVQSNAWPQANSTN